MRNKPWNVLTKLLFGLGFLIMTGFTGCEDRVRIPANADLDKEPVITIHALRSGTVGNIEKPDITSTEGDTFTMPKFCKVSLNMKLGLMGEATNTVGGVQTFHITVVNSKGGQTLYDLTANGNRDANNTGPVTLKIVSKPGASGTGRDPILVDMANVQELIVTANASNFNGESRSLSIIYVPLAGF